MNIFITTSVTGIIILFIREMFKGKLPPKWTFVLWIVLGIRLLMPVLPESDLSIFNILPESKAVDREIETENSVGFEPMEQDLSSEQVALDLEPGKEGVIIPQEGNATTPIRGSLDLITMIWLIGLIALFLYFMGIYIIFHFRTQRLPIVDDAKILDILEECKETVGIRADIVVRWGGSTPVLKGLLKPHIILPDIYTYRDLRAIFLHELMHYRYRDPLWNFIGTFILCTYWYNPLIWLCFARFREDMEVLCDYRVLRVYDDRKGYASVLMKTALEDNTFIMGTTSMQNGEPHISRRIKGIAYFKKPKFTWTIVGILFIAIVAVGCLTNPTTDRNGSDTDKTDILEYDQIYSYKTPYIGDISKVGGIVDNIYYSEFTDGISLKTDREPYGMTVKYSGLPAEWRKDSIVITDHMFTNAAIIFCLIDNVDIIEFAFYYDGASNIVNFQRETFNEMLGTDIREYATSVEKFAGELIPILEANIGNRDVEMEHFNQSYLASLCEEYSYDSGTVIEANSEEIKVKFLLYNREISLAEDLMGKIVEVDIDGNVIGEWDEKLPLELEGYSLELWGGTKGQHRYLLGVRFLTDRDMKELHSDLIAIDRNNPQKMTVLQSYTQSVDESKGRGIQDIIPTIVATTVDIIGDYMVYQDLDESYIVQDIRDGKIYDSGEGKGGIEVYDLSFEYLDVGKYIQILKYIEDESILAFNKETREFERLKKASP